jgi:hypothetical protein
MINALQRLAALLATPADPEATVHFHQGPQGRPAVCDDAGCQSPRLSV